ncbi:MAG: hypothetical protein MR210_02255 [Erysipelotrichaceae bacterium]|nr:hypothetical protein [Erysipelotrichaceae bacterium]MDY5252711.1 hypothetical protein [Erysipelotrichaceae bacterium]
MNKQKKIIILIVTACLIIAISILGFMLINNHQSDDSPVKEEKPSLSDVAGQDKPTANTAFDGIKIDLVDYTTYKLDDLDFNFVIAKIRVKADEATNINLDHFVTSENITLADYDEYVAALESKGYYLGKQNVWYELVSLETEYFSNIFIPIKDKNLAKIEVTNDIDQTTMVFDLTKNEGSKEMLRYEANDIISDGKTYQIQVSSAFDITGEQLYQNDSEYLVPSTVGIYCFNLDVISLWKDKIVIEEAYYYPDNSKEVFKALDSSIKAMKHDNIIGQEITEKSSGSLFFEAFNPMNNPITYTGTLKLKVSGSDSLIEISVDLN